MTDLFPKLFATLKAADYFTDDLEGFEDSDGRFKVFDGDESPTTETPFVSIEIAPGGQDQRTDWQGQTVTFHVTGVETDTSLLWAIANEIRNLFVDSNAFSDGTTYQTLGPADFGQGRNPVTEHRVVSVALRFGLV